MTPLPVTIGFPQIRRLLAGELHALIRPLSTTRSRLAKAQPNGLLWVREPYCFHRDFDAFSPTVAESLGARPMFIADLPEDGWPDEGGKARIAYTLPRACHRQHLRIFTVDRRPLHDLGSPAIRAQGFDSLDDWIAAWNRGLQVCGSSRNRWHDNPDVLCFTIERIDRPIREPAHVEGASR